MRLTLFRTAALGAALIVSSSAVAQVGANANTQNSQAKTSATSQQMFQVLPGTKQVITGSDRQAVQLSKEVRHELAMLPYYTLFDDLTYRVDGSTVTLGGAVVNPAVRRDAETSVKNIEGVEKVVNNIEILPPSSIDDQIRRRAARQIFSFGTLSRYSWEAAPTIHIVVKNGRITLEGVVDNQADKNAAGVQANAVPGVFSVTNNLEVAGQPSSKASPGSGQ